jgi:hypothetical protein
MSSSSNPFSGVLSSIPGYSGYRRKEDRRDADKRVREKVASAYGALADRVEAVASELAAKRRIRDIGPVDQFSSSIRHLIDRISTATYGYGGLFSDRDVDETAIGQLSTFDEGMLSGVDELEAPVAALEKALTENSDLAATANAGLAATRNLLSRFDLRNEVIETGRPVPEDQIKDILAGTPAETKKPPAFFDLHDGDAVAILGDNFIIDARIDLKTNDKALRLFRIDIVPEKWLSVIGDVTSDVALLNSSKDSYETGEQPKIGGDAFSINWSAPGTGDLIGKGGSTGERTATISALTGVTDPTTKAVVIDWGSEKQVFVGKVVHLDDIEIFGTSRA